MIVGVLGLCASILGSLMALTPLLQARAILRTHSSRDVSIGAMWLFVVNACGWLAYAVASRNFVIAFPNAVALGALTVGISTALRYRR